ncbi:hypothetical protein TSOC_013090, partial [Tetrabaena socialis]
MRSLAWGAKCGPRSHWFTGNLTEILRCGMLPAIDGWVAQHGPLTTFRLMARPFVLVADPDAARTVLHKLVNHAPLANPVMHLVGWELRSMDLHGLLMAKDEVWRMIRSAWQPAFAPASLRGYQPLMDAEALSLAERLAARADAAEEAAAAGEEGGSGGGCVVEVLSEVSRMTLAVVGTVAYGVDFNSAEYGGSDPAHTPDSAAAQQLSAPVGDSGGKYPLVQACRDWFRTMSPSARTKWAVALLLPCALPVMRRVACALPDAVLTLHIRLPRQRHPQGKPFGRLVPQPGQPSEAGLAGVVRALSGGARGGRGAGSTEATAAAPPPPLLAAGSVPAAASDAGDIGAAAARGPGAELTCNVASVGIDGRRCTAAAQHPAAGVVTASV